MWEANRKVFCYPENYVEPELRDDQSPFFRVLADALPEGEPTDLRVSEAYLGYLTSLDEVEDAEELDEADTGGKITKPRKYLRIRLSLSEYIDG